MKPKHTKSNNTIKSNAQENIPPVIQQQQIQQSIQAVLPLHHPVFLKQFSEVDNSFPERIILMTEKEQAHVHQKENREIKLKERELFHSILAAYVGLFVAAIIALAFCYGGIHVILEGYPYIGLSILGGVIVALVIAFIQGKKT